MAEHFVGPEVRNHMNPYLPPASSPQLAYPRGTKPVNRNPTDLRGIIYEWERMRVWYNAILLPFGMVVAVIAGVGGVPLTEVVFGSLAVGFFANAFYFFGPLFELYSCCSRQIREFGKWRGLIFLLGVVLSLGLFGMVAGAFVYVPSLGPF